MVEHYRQPLTFSRFFVTTMASTTNETAAAAEANQDPLECEVGIAKYLSPDVPGFFAVLKARYSDFVVHEGMYLFLVSSVCLQFLICILAS